MSALTPSAYGAGNKLPSNYKTGRAANFTPEQLDLFSSLFGNVGPDSFLAKLASGDQSAFAQMEAPAMRQFNELQGNIASRFSGMGTGGRHGSGFQNSMSSAASNFAQDLQSKRLGIQRESLQDLFNMSNMLMKQKPYENFLIEKDKNSGWGGLIGGLGGAAIGGFTGGIPGALKGAQWGYGAGNKF